MGRALYARFMALSIPTVNALVLIGYRRLDPNEGAGLRDGPVEAGPVAMKERRATFAVWLFVLLGSGVLVLMTLAAPAPPLTVSPALRPDLRRFRPAVSPGRPDDASTWPASPWPSAAAVSGSMSDSPLGALLYPVFEGFARPSAAGDPAVPPGFPAHRPGRRRQHPRSLVESDRRPLRHRAALGRRPAAFYHRRPARARDAFARLPAPRPWAPLEFTGLTS